MAKGWSTNYISNPVSELPGALDGRADPGRPNGAPELDTDNIKVESGTKTESG